MSSPALPERPDAVWSRFPLDPRSSGDLRAGDSDRELAREILTEAYAHGRLDRLEYDQRIESALQAHHLGQLVPVLNDISVPAPQSPRQPRPAPAQHSPGHRSPGPPSASGEQSPGLLQQGPVKAAIFVVAVTNAVWLLTSINSSGLNYYWPMWPALGMAIMLLAVFLFQRSPEERARHQREHELRQDRRQQRRRHRRELE